MLTNLGSSYCDLPHYLLGLTCTLSVNDGFINVALQTPCTAYLVRNEAWSAVDLSQWTFKEQRSVFTGECGKEGIVSVYTTELTAGNHIFSNESAMFLFDIDRPSIVVNGCSVDVCARQRYSTFAATGKGVVCLETPLTSYLSIASATLSLALPTAGAQVTSIDVSAAVRKMVGCD